MAKETKAPDDAKMMELRPFSLRWKSTEEWEILVEGLPDKPFVHGKGLLPLQLQNMVDSLNQAFVLGLEVGTESAHDAYKKVLEKRLKGMRQKGAKQHAHQKL